MEKERLNGMEEGLGWSLARIATEAIQKVLRKGTNFLIIELRDGERRYAISSLPVLSTSEVQLVKDALECFQETASSGKEEKTLSAFLDSFCEEKQIELEVEQREYLVHILNRLVLGAGPLEELFENDALEEVAITGLGPEQPVRVFHPVFGWLKTNLFFHNEKTIRNVVNRLAKKLGRRLSFQSPRLNAILENGSRIHAVVSPIAFSGPSVTIRKFRSRAFSPLDLLRLGTVNQQMLAWFWLVFQSDATLLVCGNTGSGKTTTLNALFSFVPSDERVIVVEETPELRLMQEHQVRLSTSADAGVSMQSLILDSLRMRPDRIVVGEIRSAEEARAFMDTLLAGQGRGSFATFHAQSAFEAIVRLKTMGILEMDIASLDGIVVQKRWSRVLANGQRKEERRIIEISEVEWKNGKLNLIPLIEWNFSSEQWQWKKEGSRLAEKIQRTFGWKTGEMEKKIEQRSQWLWENRSKAWDLDRFGRTVMEYEKKHS